MLSFCALACYGFPRHGLCLTCATLTDATLTDATLNALAHHRLVSVCAPTLFRVDVSRESAWYKACCRPLAPCLWHANGFSSGCSCGIERSGDSVCKVGQLRLRPHLLLKSIARSVRCAPSQQGVKNVDRSGAM